MKYLNKSKSLGFTRPFDDTEVYSFGMVMLTDKTTVDTRRHYVRIGCGFYKQTDNPLSHVQRLKAVWNFND
jgi:hypothetical protein